ncbi:MAG: GNAT family N-acetyltransferase [Sumerlaeia bacterium]
MILENTQSGYSSTTEPKLVFGGIELRAPKRHDVQELLSYSNRNKEFHKPWEPIRPKGYYTPDFWYSHVTRIHEDFKYGRAVRLFLFQQETSQAIGYICYNNIVRGAGNYCTIGYSVDQDFQGRGIMSQAIRMSNRYVFEELGLRRIVANYMPRNTRSGKLLKRLGFVTEGYAREFLCINGTWEDHIMTALINKRYS